QRRRDPRVRSRRRRRPRQHRWWRVARLHRAARPARAEGTPSSDHEGLMAAPARKPVIAGNWKMHHDHLVAIQVVQKLSYRLDEEDYEACDVVVCPPFHQLRTLQM